MKLAHKLCGAALVAVAGVALTVPNTTKAAEDSKTGTGHVAFTSTTNTDLIDPGSSSDTIITDSSITDPGEFGMRFVTPLEFGSHDALTSSARADYPVELYTANEGNADEFDVQNFVAFQDFRPAQDHSYKLSAAITQQFQSTAGTFLKGADITYNNLWVSNNGADTALNPAGVAPGAVALEGSDDATPGNSVAFITNTATDGKGYGKYELNFGTKDNGTDSVTLSIPTTTVKNGDYNAVVTWTLSDTI